VAGVNIRRRRVVATVALALILLLAVSGGSEALGLPLYVERPDTWSTVLDEDGRPLFHTGIMVHEGDEFTAEDDRLYRVARVDGDVAWARCVRKDTAAVEAWTATAAEAAVAPGPAAAPDRARIAIYHTHNDESYVPTSGRSSERRGGDVLEVGEEFRQALEHEGFEVEHDRTSHVPHDAGAYDRSRSTVMRLVRDNSDLVAVFDVHRDVAPSSSYMTEIDGRDVSRVMLVVGRQNPQRSANLGFARRLKAAADKRYPGLIRGIFYARGDYNQDLHPRALLLEVGSYRMPLEDAEEGIRLLAAVVPEVVGREAVARGRGADRAQGRSAWYAVLVILVLGAGALAIYLYVSAGSWEAAGRQVRRFFTQEFGDLIGRGLDRLPRWFRRRPLRTGPPDAEDQRDGDARGRD